MHSNRTFLYSFVSAVFFAGVFLLFLFPRPLAAQSGHRVDEEKFIRFNRMEQWITVHGDSSKPAVLFLHGGPGSTASPYVRSIYRDWEKDFLVIQWDQRGAGKTYGRNAPAELTPAFLTSHPLNLDSMISDGIAVTEYILQQFDKKKIILFGSSWGSVLGVSMSTRKPELYYAYIGHSQIVSPAADLTHAYEEVYGMAEKARDQTSLDVLRAIGPPLYDTARNAGRLFRIIKKYEKEHSTPAPDSIWKIAAGYDSPTDEQFRADGDDYSFANYIGDRKLGIKPIMKQIDFMKTGLVFKLPVFLIQGQEDILTSPEITRKYFDSIQAPEKEYILLPQSAHGFNIAVFDTILIVMQKISAKIQTAQP